MKKKLTYHPPTQTAKALKISLATTLINIGYAYENQGDIPKALEYYHNSLKIQEEIGNKNGIAYSLNFIGLVYNNQGDIPKALEYYHNSLETGDKEGVAIGLSNIGFVYNNQGDIPKALEYYHKSLKIREEIGDKDGIAKSLINIGYAYDNQGDIPKALEYYHNSLKIHEEIGDKWGIAMSLNNIGAIYDNQGDIPKAQEYYHKSLKIREEIGDKKGIAMSLNNIGFVYNNLGDIPKALEYYHNSLKIREEIGDKDGIANSLNNIGTVYNSQGNIPEALEYYHNSLKIREEIGDKNGIANSLSNIGGVFNNQGNTTEALEYYHNSLKIREEIGDKNGIANSLNNIGNLKFKEGQINGPDGALALALKSLRLAEKIGFIKNIKSASSLLSKVYEKQNKGMKALEMYKLSITMRDSINNEAAQKATAQQQAKYEYEKQKVLDDAEHNKQIAIENSEHEKSLALEQEEKEKQRVITYATGGGLALVVIFLIFVFNRLKTTRKQKGAIESAHHELEEKNQEIMDSIAYAKRIQSAILPPSKLVKEYLQESFILYKPKDIVAGDFYWLEHRDNKILFAAADCTGHGVPGAMVSVICNNGLNRSVREHGLTDPGKILDKTREIVIQEFEKSEEEVKDGMDIALCSLEGMKLKYAGAHNPLWIIRNGEIIETKANKQPIGKFDKQSAYTTHSFDLETGDSIYIFSDGYVDQFGGEKGKKFKAKAFRSLLLSIQDQSMEEQKLVIDDAFEAWRGSLEQIDDVCVIGVRV